MEDNTPLKEKVEREDGAAAEEIKKEKKISKKDTEKAYREEIEKLKAELLEKDDKYLRMAAEYDNFRRRSREEKDAVYDNALSDTVTEFLSLVDNLERATGFDGEKVKEGLVMISKTTDSIFAKLGVEPVGKVGEKFDPNFHNAVMHIDDDSFGEGEIVEVFQKGYKKGSKIIRFAMVKTAN